MKIVKPELIIDNLELLDSKRKLLSIERAYRNCYQTEGKMGDIPNYEWIASKVALGHLSPLEHEKITFRWICDRGVSHELVRHRIASYSQESTRYCNYSKEQFGNEITVIEPFFFEKGSKHYNSWFSAMMESERAYFELLGNGATPQEARSVLPNSTKTDIIFTMNFRELITFFKQRCHESAHPQMQQLAIPTYLLIGYYYPCLFDQSVNNRINWKFNESNFATRNTTK